MGGAERSMSRELGSYGSFSLPRNGTNGFYLNPEFSAAVSLWFC